MYTREDAFYDVIGFAECGLIRRHRLNPTVRNLGQVYKRLQQREPNILLMQDGVSVEDAQFYTEEAGITAGDIGRTSRRQSSVSRSMCTPSSPLPISGKHWRTKLNATNGCLTLDVFAAVHSWLSSSHTFASFVAELLKETGRAPSARTRSDSGRSQTCMPDRHGLYHRRSLSLAT
jgi:hypothetical protein